ncbi:DUF5050 domain-containing protein [Desulfotomaculum sp. 1211_IL3151]|uniref:DUF5050 domain-containing protein n=1 Tax=Desulfotomaculum sp. 1211_IL3151 TaxID=3084055 RepID=UPI002FD96D47
MKKIQNILTLVIKGSIYIYLPVILLLFIICEVILGRDINLSWNGIILYAVSIGVWTKNYIHRLVKEKVVDFEYLETILKKGRWKLLEQKENSLLIKPEFDFPFRMLIKDTVQIQYSDKTAIIEGPWYYVNALVNDIRGKSSIWTKGVTSIGAFVLVIVLVAIPFLFDEGVLWSLRLSYHNSQVKDVEIIEIKPQGVLGNTNENTNNYGFGVENEEYVFYVEDHLNLIRASKDFQDKNYLIQKASGTGISRLNIAGDWIFYSSGKTLNRIKIDGTDNQTIYKLSYLSDIHMKENWIYFINPFDVFNVYRMDINGRNLERFLRIQASDIALYGDRLFFSHEGDGNGYVESIGLDGNDRRVECQVFAKDLTIREDYCYFIGEDFRLNRIKVDKNAQKQILVDEKVSSYIITDNGIFYSLHSKDVGYPGEGVYRMELDGSDRALVSDTYHLEGFTHVGEWLLFHSSDKEALPVLKKLNILTGAIETI